MWTLKDKTTNGKGFYRIERDGVRVCDAFPFANEADAKWVKKQCLAIVNRMNETRSEL